MLWGREAQFVCLFIWQGHLLCGVEALPYIPILNSKRATPLNLSQEQHWAIGAICIMCLTDQQ